MWFFCLLQHPDRLWEPSNCINQRISWPERQAYNQYVCFLKFNSLVTLSLSFYSVALCLLLLQFLLLYTHTHTHTYIYIYIYIYSIYLLQLSCHAVAVVILHVCKMWNWLLLNLSGERATWATWNFGNQLSICLQTQETKKNLCRGGRSQDLPNTDF